MINCFILDIDKSYFMPESSHPTTQQQTWSLDPTTQQQTWSLDPTTQQQAQKEANCILNITFRYENANDELLINAFNNIKTLAQQFQCSDATFDGNQIESYLYNFKILYLYTGQNNFHLQFNACAYLYKILCDFHISIKATPKLNQTQSTQIQFNATHHSLHLENIKYIVDCFDHINHTGHEKKIEHIKQFHNKMQKEGVQAIYTIEELNKLFESIEALNDSIRKIGFALPLICFHDFNEQRFDEFASKESSLFDFLYELLISYSQEVDTPIPMSPVTPTIETPPIPRHDDNPSIKPKTPVQPKQSFFTKKQFINILNILNIFYMSSSNYNCLSSHIKTKIIDHLKT